MSFRARIIKVFLGFLWTFLAALMRRLRAIHQMSLLHSPMLEAAIIGAGPYGLSVAAHFRRFGIPFRIFGRPMDSWLSHMPKGMLLKSDGFASNICDPGGEFTLRQFCLERRIEYADMGTPVRLETFAAYGLAFRDRMVPDLEEKLVVSVDPCQDGFLLELENGETLMAKRVILAVGITHFRHVPANLQHLPSEFLSHSFQHSELESFRGRSVVVIGAGSSAIDLAGLLYEADADVQLVARDKTLVFHEKTPMDEAPLAMAAGPLTPFQYRYRFEVTLLCHCSRFLPPSAGVLQTTNRPHLPRPRWRMVC